MLNMNEQSEGAEFISIQAQLMDGNWVTFQLTQNIPIQIRQAMEQVKWQFPDKRVRAVDDSGHLVDMIF
jgi:hypothetical protein